MGSMSKKDQGITWKSLALTVILIPLNFYWIISGEVDLVGYALNTYAVPFYNVVFTVFILIFVNMVVRKTTRFSLFSDNEVLTTYILLSAACALSSVTFMEMILSKRQEECVFQL